MNKGRHLILESKAYICAKDFQGKHRFDEKSFSRERKLPFTKLFAMILKLVKKPY
jgi:hypothetical protein